MRAIVTAPESVNLEAVREVSPSITEWLNDPENVAHPKPLVMLDGWSVEIFDDDWNFVTRSPYWEPSTTVSTELLEADQPRDRLLWLLLAVSLANLAVLLWLVLR